MLLARFKDLISDCGLKYVIIVQLVFPFTNSRTTSCNQYSAWIRKSCWYPVVSSIWQTIFQLTSRWISGSSAKFYTSCYKYCPICFQRYSMSLQGSTRWTNNPGQMRNWSKKYPSYKRESRNWSTRKPIASDRRRRFGERGEVRSLVDNASDTVFKTDNPGRFTFVIRRRSVLQDTKKRRLLESIIRHLFARTCVTMPLSSSVVSS